LVLVDGWTVVGELKLPKKEKLLVTVEDLELSGLTKAFLKAHYNGHLYVHQKEAIQAFINGENVCLTTGTASGKSLPFYIAGMETLMKNPSAKIVAIYPMKALGTEQEERWRKTVNAAGLTVNVGRIDGNISVNSRKDILRKCQIVIMTPDVIHAWLLSHLNDRTVAQFMKSISLMVLDEVHTYTGVFGSNSAFLFRRLRHLLQLCGQHPQFIAASATIANPQAHLKNLVGLDFTFIGPDRDSSPKHEVEIILLNPPNQTDFLTEMTQLFNEIASTGERFIAFVDSRKQTELLSSILNRKKKSIDEEGDSGSAFSGEHLLSANILPFRAGYEEQDRNTIQMRLTEGSLKGIISTSALELGMDIPNLDVAVLIGVPTSATSLFQRIGRIGRHGKGKVYVINNGTTFSEMIFEHPETLLERPLGESSLYLENPRMQYIHALCLARLGGEHDQFCQMIGLNHEEEVFHSEIAFPGDFLALCRKERIGEIPADLRNMKAEAGEDPNHTYPLRDVESQFKVELKQGPAQRDLGTLSFAQVLKEAYPGAVYYYTTQAYRVYHINLHTKSVVVRMERQYTTSPIWLPTLVFPNLSEDNVNEAYQYEDLLIYESNIQVRESICGYKEQRGPSSISRNYPLHDPVYYSSERFTRNYFTSGVILTHPVLQRENIELDKMAELIYEAFLITVPFERQDIEWAVDKHRSEKPPLIVEGSKFLAIYDRTYGSLRLSGHLLKDQVISEVLEQAIQLAKIKEKNQEVTTYTTNALVELYKSTAGSAKRVSFSTSSFVATDDSLERIILPKSKGLVTYESNREFIIEDVFFSPRTSELMYRGKYLDQKPDEGNLTISIPVTKVLEIPTESQIGYYNYETGEILSEVPVR